METNTKNKTWNVLSLGAGVQSSALALMAEHGEFEEMPDLAIFADTKAEPESVYQWLSFLQQTIKNFPIHVVDAGSLTEQALKLRVSKTTGRTYLAPGLPVFFGGGEGISSRQCTKNHKIDPIIKHMRNECGIKRGQKQCTVKQWIGISLDETQRMKPSRHAWFENVFPLVDRRMSRHDCFLWMEKNNYPKPPRSSCVYCPYHNDNEWRRLKTEEPEAFMEAVQFEEKLQAVYRNVDRIDATPFLHRQCKPLGEIDFSTDVDRGQLTMWDDNWTGECEGMCGL